jgi:uncharacterized protein (TIGR02117 family)
MTRAVDTAESKPAQSRPLPPWRRGLRWLRHTLLGLLATLGMYGLLVVVGTLPVNRQWRNPAEGIEVFIYSDLVHSELSVPRVTGVVDWSHWFHRNDFEETTGREEYVDIGWGDREFFLNTPSWNEAKVSVVAGALLWPSGTVMHVSMRDKPARGKYNRRIVLTPEQYRELVTHIQDSFALGDNALPQLISGYSFYGHDCFYEARGSYSALYTCNNWTGDALKKSGVRTGWWTPYPWGLFQPVEMDRAE